MCGMGVKMFIKLKTIVLNDTPKCRNEEARECGSGKLAPLAGPATAGEKSGKFGIWQTVVLNDTPKCRSVGCPK